MFTGLLTSVHQLRELISDDHTKRNSPDELFGRAFDLIQQLGAKNVTYSHAAPFGAHDFRRPVFIATQGLPESWTSEYIDQRYFECDPISRHALSATFPFQWRDIGELTELSKRDRHYLQRLREEGLSSGICVPTFGPRGRNGYFGIGFGNEVMSFETMEFLQTYNFCQSVHLIYCEIIQEISTSDVSLSPREKDVLRLVLDGQNNKMISRELDISVHSVATYLIRAHEKLGTNDRFSAATRAMTLGMLD